MTLGFLIAGSIVMHQRERYDNHAGAQDGYLAHALKACSVAVTAHLQKRARW